MDHCSNDVKLKMAALAKELEACRPAFLAIGDENRQHILIALLGNFGGMRVGEITKKTNLSRPAVSHHLKILKAAGIVNMFKKGTMNFYFLDANESQWAQIASLVNNINQLVREVSLNNSCVENNN